MSKVGLKDTIKDLNQKAGVILSETERVKRNADIILQMLKTQESVFLRQEEEERLRIKHEQHQQMLQSQTKAWTMPDDDEQAILDAAAEQMQSAPAAEAETAPVTAEIKEEAPVVVETKPVEKPAEETTQPVVKTPEVKRSLLRNLPS